MNKEGFEHNLVRTSNANNVERELQSHHYRGISQNGHENPRKISRVL